MQLLLRILSVCDWDHPGRTQCRGCQKNKELYSSSQVVGGRMAAIGTKPHKRSCCCHALLMDVSPDNVRRSDIGSSNIRTDKNTSDVHEGRKTIASFSGRIASSCQGLTLSLFLNDQVYYGYLHTIVVSIRSITEDDCIHDSFPVECMLFPKTYIAYFPRHRCFLATNPIFFLAR